MDSEITIVKDRTVSEESKQAGIDHAKKVGMKSMTEIREKFAKTVSRLEQQLSTATLFEDTDSIQDRSRMLKLADDAITSFLKLVNEYYRMELQLRFKVGVRQDVEQMEKYDDEVQKGFHIIDETRSIMIAQLPNQSEETGVCKHSLTL
jgi:hypothetical protein